MSLYELSFTRICFTSIKRFNLFFSFGAVVLAMYDDSELHFQSCVVGWLRLLNPSVDFVQLFSAI